MVPPKSRRVVLLVAACTSIAQKEMVDRFRKCLRRVQQAPSVVWPGKGLDGRFPANGAGGITCRILPLDVPPQRTTRGRRARTQTASARAGQPPSPVAEHGLGSHICFDAAV